MFLANVMKFHPIRRTTFADFEVEVHRYTTENPLQDQVDWEARI